jgi:hypothetical protein
MPIFLELTGPQRAALQKAILKAYDSAIALDRMLQAQLDKKLNRFTSMQLDYPTNVFDLLRSAQAEGWLADLILAALQHNPRPHPALEAVAQTYGLTAVPPSEQPGLERLLNRSSTFIDISTWRATLGELEHRVCRVETPSTKGTGFLVGPDRVLTNYHVVEDLVQNGHGWADVVCRFDYKVIETEDTTEEVHPGVTFALAADGLLDYSPYSDMDTKPDPKPGLPEATDLDYALLQLAEPAGDLSVGKTEDVPGAGPRGFIDLLETSGPPAVGDPLLLLQHPDGRPLKMAFATDAVLAVDGIGPRLRHSIDTLHGSSGSPCFNERLELVALHHAGDPAHPRLASFNQAVPIASIRALLEQRGKLPSVSV